MGSMSTAVTVLWLILQSPAASLEWMDTAVSVMAMAPTLTLNVKYQVSYELPADEVSLVISQDFL